MKHFASKAAALTPPAPAPRPRAQAGAWHARALEQASAYLPLLLMALLALSTWWLVKNTPLSDNTRAAAAPRHEPDYTMTQFMVQRFAADGALRAQIEGDRLRHYPDTDTLEVDNAHIRAVGPDGRVTLADARSALSNGDGSEVQLRGGAHVVRLATATDAAVDFRGEFLQAYLNTERVRSHLPVVVTHGGVEVHADAMDYDNLERVVQLKGGVHATFSAASTPAQR